MASTKKIVGMGCVVLLFTGLGAAPYVVQQVLEGREFAREDAAFMEGWRQVDNENAALLNSGDFQGALTNAHEAEQYLSGFADADKQYTAFMHDFYAYAYKGLGEFDKAIEHFEAAVETGVSHEWQRGNYLAHWKNELGLLYSTRSQFSEAIENYGAAAEIWSSSTDRHKDYAIIARANLGQVCHTMGSWDLAEKHYAEALHELEVYYDPDPAAAALLFNNYGLLYMDMKNYEESEKLLLNALKYAYDDEAGDPSFLGTVNANAGVLYFRQLRFDDAERYFKEALSIYQAVGVSSGQSYGIALSCLGEIDRERGELASAKTLHLEALELMEKAADSSELHIARQHSVLGHVYLDTGEYEESRRHYEIAITTFQRLSPEHPDLPEILTGYANALLRLQEFELTDKTISDALKLNEKVHGKENEVTAHLLNTRGALYTRLGSTDKAVEYLRSSIAIYESNGLTHIVGYAHALNNLALELINLKDYVAAKEMFELSLETYDSIYGPGYHETATILCNLASVIWLEGELIEPERHYRNALEIAESVYGSAHPETVDVRNKLIAYYDEMGLTEKAEALRGDGVVVE